MKKSGCFAVIAGIIIILFVFVVVPAIQNYFYTKRVTLPPIERVDYETSILPREEPELNYYYYQFDESKYDADTLKVIDAFFNQEESIFIEDADKSVYFDMRDNLYDFFHEDYLSTYWFEMYEGLGYERIYGGIKISFSYNADVVDDYIIALSKAKEIMEQIDITYLTDIGVAKAAHDYIVLNTEYAFEAVDNNTIDNPVNHAYGALVNRRAVCGGYTKAYSLLLSLAGIENRYVSGDEVFNHAWNMVEIDGVWYHCDSTHDDLQYDGCVSYKYFLKNDVYMRASEERRIQSDLHAVGESYYFESSGYEVYSFWPKTYALTLVDNNLVRYEIKDNVLDKNSGKVLAHNVFSWYLRRETGYIIYNDLYKGTLKTKSLNRIGGKSYRSIKKTDYIVSADYENGVFTINYVKDMHGEPYDVNINIH